MFQIVASLKGRNPVYHFQGVGGTNRYFLNQNMPLKTTISNVPLITRIFLVLAVSPLDAIPHSATIYFFCEYLTTGKKNISHSIHFTFFVEFSDF